MKKSRFALLALTSLFLVSCSSGTSSTTPTVIQGEKGEDGVDGKDGASVLTGNGEPASTLGNDGDSYIDLDTFDYYTKSDGTWTKQGNLKGADGSDGKDGSDGTNGTDGSDGADGKDGSSVLTGNGEPASTLGNDGDSYIDLDTFDYYTKSDGTWTKQGNLKGADGSDGSKGDAGENAPHYGETFTITYHLNGGEMPSDVSTTATVGWGDTVDLPLPTYYGHIFEGWFIDGDVNSAKQFYSSDAVFKDLDLYAKWSVGAYTLTCDFNGGTYNGLTTYSHTYIYGDTYTIPSNLSKTGYIFTGWTLDGETFSNTGTYNYEDITVVAQFEEAMEYTITLDLNGGSYDGETTITVLEQEEYTLPSSGITNGEKVFTGWYNGTEKWEYTGIYLLSENVTLTANWVDLITYPVSLDLNGGTIEEETTPTSITNQYYYSEEYSLPIPSKENYTFDGYFIDHVRLTDEKGVVVNSGLLSTSSTSTLTAKYLGNDTSHIGDLYQFGKYPQTEVTSSTLLFALSNTIDTDNDGYIEYDGKEYLKATGKGNNGYSSDSTYYFEVEPISWEVKSDGTLITEQIIDAQQYYTDSSDRTYQNATIYSNNYEYSIVRAYLNGYDGSDYGVSDYSSKGFYDLAFNDEEKNEILLTTVDNSTATTASEASQYACDNTSDKVFLFSYQDMLKSDYGYSTSANISQTRFKIASDYSIYQGLYNYASTSKIGLYWLRSPGYDKSHASYVYYNGSVSYGGGLHYNLGLSPAIKINF